MNATSSRLGKIIGSAFMVSLALASFYTMLWIVWDL